MQLRRTFPILSLALVAGVNALAAELPAALASGALRSEQFMPKPKIEPGAVPRACVMASRLRADPRAGITSRDQQALFWWGKLHFKFEGGCTDWDYVVGKWQETIGNPVTGSLTAADVAALSKTSTAATASLGAAVDADTLARQREKARLAEEAAAAARAKARSARAGGGYPAPTAWRVNPYVIQAMEEDQKRNEDDLRRMESNRERIRQEEDEAFRRRNEQIRREQERLAEEERQEQLRRQQN